MGGLKVQAGGTEVDVDGLVALAKRAGDAILAVYATGGEVRHTHGDSYYYCNIHPT